MAECMVFLDKYLDVYDDMFDGFADGVIEELLEDRGMDEVSEKDEELLSDFKYDYLIEDLFVALQDAFDSLRWQPYWDRWNEKMDEMIGEGK